jgi:predicted acyl esterase
LLISGEPFRARFRKSFEKPEPLIPSRVEEYAIDLHWGHHRFRKGHKIMLQVSSTWFPLIDRNPQTYVPNIFEAKDADFQPAQQRVYHTPEYPSHLLLDTLPPGAAGTPKRTDPPGNSPRSPRTGMSGLKPTRRSASQLP